jgi:hypothetical protein
MSILPQGTILGNLEILEIYEFYDKPCLFSCKNVSGQIFLAVWIDETSSEDTWLYVSMSKNRFQQVVSAKIELKDVFLHAEDNFVFEVCIPHKNKNQIQVLRINCQDLEEDKLPVQGEFLNCESSYLESLNVKNDILSTSIQSRRVALNMAFKFSSMNQKQAPIHNLGILLQSTQLLIDAIGQFKAGQATTKGTISNRILNQTQLVAVGTYKGSFGVEMISNFEPDLWGNSLAEESIESFLELVKIGKNSEKLREFLLSSKPRTALRYRVFIEKLIFAKSSLIVEWASFSKSKTAYAELSIADAKIILEIVSAIEAEVPRLYEILGELVGANKRTKFFEMWDTKEDRKKYSGRILDLALPVAESSTIGKIYKATIQETIEVSPITGEEKVKYQLVDLKDYELDK